MGLGLWISGWRTRSTMDVRLVKSGYEDGCQERRSYHYSTLDHGGYRVNFLSLLALHNRGF